MTGPKKVDLRRELKHLYGPSARVVVEVEVPEMRFLKLDRVGDPNTSETFREAVEGLYAVSYALKFAVKKKKGLDYRVMPLEGLWWTEKGMTDLIRDPRGQERLEVDPVDHATGMGDRRTLRASTQLPQAEEGPTCALRDEVRALQRGTSGTGHALGSFRRRGTYYRADRPPYRRAWRNAAG